MAEGAIKAAADSCIGSLITLTTKSGMRYEGCLNHVDAQECTIALHSVKSFGTEGRRKVFVVSPSEKIYEYIVFQGSDIKELRVISSPSSPQIVPSVLDDPAIIESRDSLPPPMHTSLTSTGAVKAPDTNTAAPSGHPISSVLGNPSSNQLPTSVQWRLSHSPTHVNVIKTAMPLPSYLPGLIGSLEQVSQTQSHNFPPLQHSGLNASFGGASTYTEPNHPLNQLVFTTAPQYCTQQFTTAIPGLSPTPGLLTPNHACGALSAVTMISVPQKTSVATAFGVGADPVSVTKEASAIPGPVPSTSTDIVSRKFVLPTDLLPNVPASLSMPSIPGKFATAESGFSPVPGPLTLNYAHRVLSGVMMDSVLKPAGNVSAVPVLVTNEAASILGSMDTVSRRFPFTPDLLPGALDSPSSKYLQNAIAGGKAIKLSALEPQPSGNVEEAEKLLSKPATTTVGACSPPCLPV